MIITGSRQEAAATRRDYSSPSGMRAAVDTYIGTNRALSHDSASDGARSARDPAGTYPMAYLVAQAPGNTLQAHYHQADQFQVFVAGSGRIGSHMVQPLVVHFAGAYSPYGPIVAGSKGLQYLTLRRSWDPGAQWMPEAAQKLRDMPARRHRIYTSDIVELDTPDAPGPGESRVERLFAEQEMGAWLVQLGAEAKYDLQATVDRFVYVLGGQADAGSSTLPAGACLFASADEGRLILAAGPEGARVLLAQFDR